MNQASNITTATLLAGIVGLLPAAAVASPAQQDQQPAQAEAACAAPASVKAAAKRATVRTGQLQSIRYSGCGMTNGQTLRVQVYQVAAAADSGAAAPLTTQEPRPYGPARSYRVNGSEVRGGIAFKAYNRGQYLLRVSVDGILRGQAGWGVEAPAPAESIPTPLGSPVLGEPAPTPQGSAEAHLRLSGALSHRSGDRVVLRARISNTGLDAARDSRVCMRVPAALQLMRVSREVSFRGSQACASLGHLAAGASRTITWTLRRVPGDRSRRVQMTLEGQSLTAEATSLRRVASFSRARAAAKHAPVTG